MIGDTDRMREVMCAEDGWRGYPPSRVSGGALTVLGARGATALPGGESGVRGAPALPRVIANWKHWLTARYGIAFQANFWDTRLRDEAHYAEKFRYVCNNPVRKGLCASAREWRPVIAFDRESDEEVSHV